MRICDYSTEQTQPQVVLLEDPHIEADDVYENAGFVVKRISGSLDESELIQVLSDAQVVGLRSKTTITRRVIESCPKLIAIGCYCIGTNQVDLEACNERGVAVFNAPYSNTRSVVEMAVASIIALARRLPVKNAALQRGVWEKTSSGSHEIRGKTLGIIGYGSIGTQLSVLAEALGMQVVFYDEAQRLALGNARCLGSIEEVLKLADFVSLHVDGRPGNRNLFGEKEFSLMKPGAIFINLARGFVVDVNALANSLRSGKLAGAAVDVFPEEPKKNGDPFTSPLVGLENTILTPHVGGSTLEAQYDIGQFVSGKIVQYWKDGSSDMSVNIPNLTLQSNPDSRYRLSLLHRNTPGVLALVNQTLAEHGANINGQILSTSGSYGYALTEIASELPQEAIAAIESMPDTIGLRVMSL